MRTSQPASVAIVVLSGPREGEVFPFAKPALTIGRSAQADITLNEKSVSRLHCKLSLENGACLIEDLGSTNGTWLFGQRLREKTQLPFNSCFCLGEIVFKLNCDAPAGPSLRSAKTILCGVRPVSLDPSVKTTVEAAEPAGSPANRTLLTIHQFHRVMTIIDSDEDTSQKILRAFLGATGSHRGFLLEYDLKTGRLVPTASRSVDEGGDYEVSRADEIDHQLVEHVKDRFEAILAVGAGPSPELIICLPLLGRRHLNGVIYLIADGPVGRLNEDDVRLFAFLAVSAGMAVEHKRMVEFNAKNELLLATGMNTAELSHCVKNMLASVDAGLTLLKAGLDDRSVETALEAWSLLRIGHRRIEGVVMDILNASSDKKMRFILHDLNAILRELGRIITPQFAHNRITLVLKPHPAGHLIAQVDFSGIHRVLMNLLTNAEQAILAKRLDDAAFQGVVELAVTGARDQATLTVADNGVGLGGVDPEQFFSPFHSTKGAAGTGLGLYASKRIIEAHGGTISAAENPGGGCVFTITLPQPHMSTETRVIKLF